MAASLEELSQAVAPYTMTGPERRSAMMHALLNIEEWMIEGDVVECGVWMGGNIILARTLCPGRICWLYDTFSGMTLPGPHDISSSGLSAVERYNERAGLPWAAASVGEVKDTLRKAHVYDDDYLRFVVGDVEETLKAESPDRIALLRLDTDWHASTKIELEVLYPRLSPGGVLIVDDYGHWHGAKRAVDEYFADSRPRMVYIDYTAVMMTKPC